MLKGASLHLLPFLVRKEIAAVTMEYKYRSLESLHFLTALISWDDVQLFFHQHFLQCVVRLCKVCVYAGS